ncbi:hypothetical protein RHSIM_Rhsim02G0198000 [Rhododendron simsii]|uniref:RNase H type-1 domain-containing protein n=1 Tax=Rhododendron simsii TaxID=118357 RepID=A0A834HBS8_RHOSS|nr:hypothetical protein RHSIM_Rhsim02G0198000 [Rhododendron simsii]
MSREAFMRFRTMTRGVALHKKNCVIEFDFLRSSETVRKYFNDVLSIVLRLQGIDLLKAPEPLPANSTDVWLPEDEANALALAETEARIAATEAHMEWIQQPADARRSRFMLGTKRPVHEWNLFSGDAWRMTVDGVSNVHGAGAGIVLVSPEGTVHESVVSIGYRATNNEAEYEALIAGLQLALRLGADSVHMFCDSRLIVGHLNDDYQARDERMNAYVSHVLALLKQFGRVEIEWIAREHNAHADALAGLASVYRASGSCTVVFDEIDTPSFEPSDTTVAAISPARRGRVPQRIQPIIDRVNTVPHRE